MAIEKEFVKSFAKHKSDVKKKIELQEASNLESNNTNPVSNNNLANFLDKLDIHEEITRFNDHLNNLILVINSLDKKTLGKQIDFILQECNREINTMSAKATNSLISSLAIEVKVEIEKAREQVQNIV